MNIYQENILKYNFNENVVKNMLLASAMHDISHDTNFHDELQKWLKENKKTTKQN